MALNYGRLRARIRAERSWWDGRGEDAALRRSTWLFGHRNKVQPRRLICTDCGHEGQVWVDTLAGKRFRCRCGAVQAFDKEKA